MSDQNIHQFVTADRNVKDSDYCYARKETAAKCSSNVKNGVTKSKGKASCDQRVVLRRINHGGVGPKKRTGKKDRHSKIRTAQGIRDRRMRLSLQAARKFFDLQDLLGYDKASKTIEWLFSKSKKAIKELMVNKDTNNNNNHSLSITEQVGLPRIIEENFEPKKLGFVPNIERKSEKNVSRPNTKESREKARARARCRTREKMMVKLGLDQDLSQYNYWCKYSSPNYYDVLEKLGSCSNSPFDQESGCYNSQLAERVSSGYGSDEYYPSNLLVSQQQLLADDVGTIEKLLENSNSSTRLSCAPVVSDAVSCFVDSDSGFMGFFGSWDLLMNSDIMRLNFNNQLDAVTNEVHRLGDNPNSVDDSAATLDFPLFHQEKQNPNSVDDSAATTLDFPLFHQEKHS
ncbi:hypothetical protein ABFX02_12G084500 [Erythranthe guttata]